MATANKPPPRPKFDNVNGARTYVVPQGGEKASGISVGAKPHVNRNRVRVVDSEGNGLVSVDLSAVDKATAAVVSAPILSAGSYEERNEAVGAALKALAMVQAGRDRGDVVEAVEAEQPRAVPVDANETPVVFEGSSFGRMTAFYAVVRLVPGALALAADTRERIPLYSPPVSDIPISVGIGEDQSVSVYSMGIEFDVGPYRVSVFPLA